MPQAAVHPGTLMNVTPLSEAPIMPKLTSSHEAFLFALKKVALVAPREVILPIKTSTPT